MIGSEDGKPLKTLTSLVKEARPFVLGENSIWSFPLFLPLPITAFGGPEGYSGLAIIAFGAFQFIVPKYLYFRNEKSAQRGSFGTDIPADIRPKTSVRPSKSWKNKHFGTDIPRGRP